MMQPFVKVALSALLAHLVGDFAFQPSRVVIGKSKRTRAYLAHGAIHLVVLILCVGTFAGFLWLTEVRFWVIAVLYILAHLCIDAVDHRFIRAGRLAGSASVFVVAQLVHCCTIPAFAWFLTYPSWSSVKAQFAWSMATQEKVLEAGIVYVAVVFAGGYLIRYLTRNLTAAITVPGQGVEQLQNAGMYIGWLERFLVVTAILIQAPSMVGLILTGKSIARFPELKEQFAEYFLIGTLLSIGLAVIGGLVLAKLWYGTISLK